MVSRSSSKCCYSLGAGSTFDPQPFDGKIALLVTFWCVSERLPGEHRLVDVVPNGPRATACCIFALPCLALHPVRRSLPWMPLLVLSPALELGQAPATSGTVASQAYSPIDDANKNHLRSRSGRSFSPPWWPTSAPVSSDGQDHQNNHVPVWDSKRPDPAWGNWNKDIWSTEEWQSGQSYGKT